MSARIALVLAALCASAVSACGQTGSGDSSTAAPSAGAAGGLRWAKAPQVFVPANLPNDRVMAGVLRNDSLRRLRIKASELELRDARGRAVRGSVAFLNGYLHGLDPPTRARALDDRELVRLGRLARLDPGSESPVTVSWRVARGTDPPVSLAYGDLVVPVPQRITARG